MRIVCPRCVAQYEVDESAIPQAGREVQCANCENIWFQDYIEMLPTDAEDEAAALAEEDRGVFDDLDGKTEANFYSNRGAADANAPESLSTDFDADIEGDDATDLLADDIDDDLQSEPLDHEADADDEDDYDDDAPAAHIPTPPVDPDVLDVLRSEAAFSSARAKLDAAAADALDGAGAATDDETPAADDPLDDDDLAAFLDAHGDAPESATAIDPSEDDSDDVDDTDPDAADTGFDPLADLDAIRSQLDTIGAEQTEESVEYTPNLPADDPTPKPDDTPADFDDITGLDTDDDDFEPEYDDVEPADAAISAVMSDTSTFEPATDHEDDTDEDDDFDDVDDGPRHAYRADGGTQAADTGDAEAEDASLSDIDDLADEPSVADTTDEVTPKDDPSIVPAAAAATVGAATAALGMTRPKSKGTRARTLPGYDAVPARAPTDTPTARPPADDLSDTIADAARSGAEDTPDIDLDDVSTAVDTDRQPKRTRKAMLPDVDELDASLRSEGDEPRRRDREMMEAHEDAQNNAGTGGFRRAFIWTIFIIALLIALYVLRPQIVNALPAAAMVLDPYANVVDMLRGLINGVTG